VERASTIVQLAKWSQDEASSLVEEVTKIVTDHLPSKTKAAEREKEVRLQLAKVGPHSAASVLRVPLD
jgi:hypothetical protein